MKWNDAAWKTALNKPVQWKPMNVIEWLLFKQYTLCTKSYTCCCRICGNNFCLLYINKKMFFLHSFKIVIHLYCGGDKDFSLFTHRSFFLFHSHCKWCFFFFCKIAACIPKVTHIQGFNKFLNKQRHALSYNTSFLLAIVKFNCRKVWMGRYTHSLCTR